MPQDPTLGGLPGLSRCGNTGVALGRREDEVEIVPFIMPVVEEHAVPGVVMGDRGAQGWHGLPSLCSRQPVLTQVVQGALVHLEPRGGRSPEGVGETGRSARP